MDLFRFLSAGWKTRLLLGLFLISLGLLSASAAPGENLFQASRWIGGYNSDDSGLSDKSGPAGKRIYTLRRLERLRKAVSPRYVRVLDWKKYGQSGGALNKGILFTYSGYRSREVYLAGNFSNWRPLPMIRNDRGVYFYILPLQERLLGKKTEDYVFRYKFLVDGIWTHDPVNFNRDDDGLGAYLSTYRLDGLDVNRNISVRPLDEPGPGGERLVEFAIYLPRVQNLSLVGTFNNWNPEHDLPQKGPDGIFRLRLRLKPGEYVYKYIADGRWILDRYNPHTRLFEELGELCSYLKIE